MEILSYFPNRIKNLLQGYLLEMENLTEIRLRINQPIILKNPQTEKIVQTKIIYEEISEILQKLCDNSIYAYQSEIASGFITIKGGHRVGIAGSIVIKNGQIININHVSSMNFRIARQIENCSKDIFNIIVNSKNEEIKNTLIASIPGAGKTTLVRDLIKKISTGDFVSDGSFFCGQDLSIIDERGELAAIYRGVPQYDIGIRTDVLNNVSKPEGIKMAVRSLAPKVIVADEIGNKNDSDAIQYAICSGVKGIFTAHANNIEELRKNREIGELLKLNLFDIIIFLDEKSKGKVKKVYTIDEYRKACELD